MKLHLNSRAKNETAVDQTLVVFSQIQKKSDSAQKNGSLKSAKAKILEPKVSKLLEKNISDESISGKASEFVFFRDTSWENFRHLAVMGTGKASISAEEVRQIAATVYQNALSLKLKHVLVSLEGFFNSKKENSKKLQAFVEGLGLASYDFSELKTDKSAEPKEIEFELIHSQGNSSEMKKAFHEAQVLFQAVNFSRRLGDLPGNLMTPTILAETVAVACKDAKVKASIWDLARIKKENMGGLAGVARGSCEEPRFIVLEYSGAAKSKKPLVFVGKGLTFDSGGISIKPSAAMEEMKYDMCGGANVLGSLLAIANLKLKVNAIALVPASENMPDGRATKPGDVHKARNGKTFEVNNTDAEGRLILADALSYASELKPEMIVDAATLTGAIVVALGNTHTGYFTRNKELKNKVEKAAENSGELVWNMPLIDHHVKDMKGTFADLSNMSSGKGAGSATAAAFLEQFVVDGIPWAHFDIAGTAWAVGGRLPYCTKKGASGVMLRTFVELAKLYQ